MAETYFGTKNESEDRLAAKTKTPAEALMMKTCNSINRHILDLRSIRERDLVSSDVRDHIPRKRVRTACSKMINKSNEIDDSLSISKQLLKSSIKTFYNKWDCNDNNSTWKPNHGIRFNYLRMKKKDNINNKQTAGRKFMTSVTVYYGYE